MPSFGFEAVNVGFIMPMKTCNQISFFSLGYKKPPLLLVYYMFPKKKVKLFVSKSGWEQRLLVCKSFSRGHISRLVILICLFHFLSTTIPAIFQINIFRNTTIEETFRIYLT